MPENLSDETKFLLEVAEKEAKELGCAQVETSHLPLALILDKGRTGEILKSVGATEQAAREHLKPSDKKKLKKARVGRAKKSLHCPECHAMRLEARGLRYTLLSSENLGAKIREKRTARGLTQAQLVAMTSMYFSNVLFVITHKLVKTIARSICDPVDSVSCNCGPGVTASHWQRCIAA